MTRFNAALIGLVVAASTASASDPAASRPVRKLPPSCPAPINPYLKAAADLDARDRTIAKCVSQMVTPQPRIAEAMNTLAAWRYDTDANFRMARLLNESEDLRQAREEIRRFWMNNQPSILTYERLNGAIGP